MMKLIILLIYMMKLIILLIYMYMYTWRVYVVAKINLLKCK